MVEVEVVEVMVEVMVEVVGSMVEVELVMGRAQWGMRVVKVLAMMVTPVVSAVIVERIRDASFPDK